MIRKSYEYRETTHLIFIIFKKSEQIFCINLSKNYLNAGCLIWTYIHLRLYHNYAQLLSLFVIVLRINIPKIKKYDYFIRKRFCNKKCLIISIFFKWT